MTYQVLARKWRPHRFKDMVGQEHILRMLSNALEQKRLHHAYLLTGTRGVGKTTLARIMAKCLNCETGITPTPCDTCATCKSIDAGQFLDLFEIDAASRTKVEDTRDILENVPYPPTQGRYKIYLIDEVHMLSNHSFNALLKTLEEPPEHVKFILATTDPKKLPITILSRCLQFHLKRITPEQIAAHLQQIGAAENLSCDTSALSRIAKAADGSMRDALSLLDQAIAYGHGAVNTADVNAMLGSMAQDDILPLLTALAEKNGMQLFTAISQLAERAPDFKQVLEELISALHQIAITQMVPNAISVDESLKQLATAFTPEEIQLYYQIALLGRRDLAHAPNPHQGFEMTMLRMLAFKPGIGTEVGQHTISQTASAPKQSTAQAPVAARVATTEKSAAAPMQRSAPAMENAAPVKQVAAEPTTIDTATLPDWRELLPKLELTGMAYALASNCTLSALSDKRAELTLAITHQPMLNPKLKERITEALSRVLGKPILLDIVVTTAEIATPVKQQHQEQQSRLATATKAIMEDPRVRQFIDLYDATVEVSLV